MVTTNEKEFSEFHRLRVLRSTGLLDMPVDSSLDRLTSFVATQLNASTCLISLVDKHRQFFSSAYGLAQPWCELRETPLSHSICKYVVRDARLLDIPDVQNDPLTKDEESASVLGVGAYLGAPIYASNGAVLGSLCLLDTEKRTWEASDRETLEMFARVVGDQLAEKAKLHRLRLRHDLVLHDLAGPLSGVSIAMELIDLQKDILPDTVRDCLPPMQDSVNQLRKILKEAGNLDSHLDLPTTAGKTDFGNVICSVVDRHAEAATRKGITVEWNQIEESVDLEVENWKVERVVDNLLSNAVKYTPRNGTITVQTFCGEEEVGFEVHDTGPGFSKEDEEQLYKRYSKLSARPTAEEKSTGLGLYITKSLVEEINGKIELLETPEGEGAKFRVSFRRN